MDARRRDERAAEMYEAYSAGLSLAEVAAKFQCTRQSVFGLFSGRGWPMRQKALPLPHVIFNGEKYTLRNHGYYGKTRGSRSLLHRDVWGAANGPIPSGHDIHHRDEDGTNNALENLECLPKAEHTRLYSPHNNQYTRGRKLVACGA